MRKNKTMRAATLLLALVLITSCFVGGTFAKYVTTDNSSDSARVAKFGVVLTASDNSSFKTVYNSDTTDFTGVTVKSSTTDSLVAPGTKDDGGITFTISGTPEVATKISAVMTEDYEEVFLKAGTYTDYTTRGTDGNHPTFALSADYYPVVFTLKQQDKETPVATGKLSDINTALATYTASAQYAPNVDLGATFTLTWAWAFGDSANNQADTVLGQIAAGTYTGLTDGTDYNLDINYTITFTVEQID